MDEDDNGFEGRTPARKFQKIDLLILGANLVSEILSDIADAFESLTMLSAAHANYNVEREQFRQDATFQIETITGEQE